MHVKVVNGTTLEDVEKSMGQDAGFITEYKGFSVMNKSVVIPTFVDMDKVPFEKVEGSEEERIEAIVRNLSKFDYEADQSDPLLVQKAGGNCQAVSLLLYKALEENGFTPRFVLDQGVSHMWVETPTKQGEVSIDLVQGKVVMGEVK